MPVRASITQAVPININALEKRYASGNSAYIISIKPEPQSMPLIIFHCLTGLSYPPLKKMQNSHIKI